jgi:hypothetical protein
MTAVEWLVQQIETGKIEIVYSDKIHSIRCLPEFVKAALEMEKQQIERMYSEEEIKEAYWNRTDEIDVDGYWINDPEKDLEGLLKELKKIHFK